MHNISEKENPKNTQRKWKQTKRNETNSFGHSSQDVKRIVQGSDFQFKKLHAKAPQIKGIDSVQGAEGEGNSEAEAEREKERGREVEHSFHQYNKFQSKT